MAKAKKRTVEGVDLARVDEDLLHATIKRFGIEDDDGSLESSVRRLVIFFRDTVPKNRIAECSTCGGDSDADLDACPFCGDDGMTEPSTGVLPRGQERPVRVVDAAQSLDENVAEIQRLKQTAATNIWELGKAIRANYESELWKQRRDTKGDVVYRNWKQFCSQELGMSHVHAYKLMDVAAAFTAEQIAAIGATKLGLMLKVPADKRQPLLDAASDGASKTQISDAVKEMTGKQPPKKDGKVTVAQAPGRVVLPLMKRGSDSDPATNINQQPWAEELMTNDVRVRYVVSKSKNGAWVLVIERGRLL